ncbi:MAG: hypothetical protein Q8L64_04995 [bacterium]|nr:hypothetical protein [bacterium]
MNYTPVLITIFNRPDKVRALMSALALVKPSRLYVAADGPRHNVTTDVALCDEARAIASSPSWPCEVETLFSEKNLGVDPAVERAISWFFDNEESGIILEDDCIPHPDFFHFATEMLDRYTTDERVMMISGNNYQNGQKRGDGSYYFSRYANTWGWATWRRSWKHYDTKLSSLDSFISSDKVTSIRPADEIKHWTRYFKKLKAGIHTPWDAKWIFAIWNNDGLCVVPNANLVENIGFGSDATHTANSNSQAVRASSFPPPYHAPSTVVADDEADRYLFESIYRLTFLRRLRHAVRVYLHI